MIIRDDVISQHGLRACATRPTRRAVMRIYASPTGRRDLLRATAMTRQHKGGKPCKP